LELLQGEKNKLITLMLDVGEALIYSGAEINRVENTLEHIGKAYCAKRVNVFALNSYISLTVDFDDEENITKTRRVLSKGDTDLQKIDELNALSRSLELKPIALPELESKINEITARKIPYWKTVFGHIVGAGSFAVFFGGSLLDGAFAALIGLLLAIIKKYIEGYMPNKVFYTFAVSVFTSVMAYIAVRLVPALDMGKVIIGDIMLIVPGIAITNAFRSIMVGDTISGSMRLIECLLWASALAAGIMLPVLLLGGV